MRLARKAGYDRLGREIVECVDATHSGRVAALSGMDGYIVIPADTEVLPANALVEFYPF
jgi:molybdopterin biosynthesis enzyme